ncbi:unnamed protein product [Amoebophrya sp. A120]|nr:unnamed protein product [Amoebophrya sp. A120]|eukprot:GSA120T00016943001.1
MFHQDEAATLYSSPSPSASHTIKLHNHLKFHLNASCSALNLLRAVRANANVLFEDCWCSVSKAAALRENISGAAQHDSSPPSNPLQLLDGAGGGHDEEGAAAADVVVSTPPQQVGQSSTSCFYCPPENVGWNPNGFWYAKPDFLQLIELAGRSRSRGAGVATPASSGAAAPSGSRTSQGRSSSGGTTTASDHQEAGSTFLSRLRQEPGDEEHCRKAAEEEERNRINVIKDILQEEQQFAEFSKCRDRLRKYLKKVETHVLHKFVEAFHDHCDLPGRRAPLPAATSDIKIETFSSTAAEDHEDDFVIFDKLFALATFAPFYGNLAARRERTGLDETDGVRRMAMVLYSETTEASMIEVAQKATTPGEDLVSFLADHAGGSGQEVVVGQHDNSDSSSNAARGPRRPSTTAQVVRPVDLFRKWLQKVVEAKRVVGCDDVGARKPDRVAGQMDEEKKNTATAKTTRTSRVLGNELSLATVDVAEQQSSSSVSTSSPEGEDVAAPAELPSSTAHGEIFRPINPAFAFSPSSPSNNADHSPSPSDIRARRTFEAGSPHGKDKNEGEMRSFLFDTSKSTDDIPRSPPPTVLNPDFLSAALRQDPHHVQSRLQESLAQLKRGFQAEMMQINRLGHWFGVVKREQSLLDSIVARCTRKVRELVDAIAAVNEEIVAFGRGKQEKYKDVGTASPPSHSKAQEQVDHDPHQWAKIKNEITTFDEELHRLDPRRSFFPMGRRVVVLRVFKHEVEAEVKVGRPHSRTAASTSSQAPPPASTAASPPTRGSSSQTTPATGTTRPPSSTGTRINVAVQEPQERTAGTTSHTPPSTSDSKAAARTPSDFFFHAAENFAAAQALRINQQRRRVSMTGTAVSRAQLDQEEQRGTSLTRSPSSSSSSCTPTASTSSSAPSPPGDSGLLTGRSSTSVESVASASASTSESSSFSSSTRSSSSNSAPEHLVRVGACTAPGARDGGSQSSHAISPQISLVRHEVEQFGRRRVEEEIVEQVTDADDSTSSTSSASEENEASASSSSSGLVSRLWNGGYLGGHPNSLLFPSRTVEQRRAPAARQAGLPAAQHAAGAATSVVAMSSSTVASTNLARPCEEHEVVLSVSREAGPQATYDEQLDLLPKQDLTTTPTRLAAPQISQSQMKTLLPCAANHSSDHDRRAPCTTPNHKDEHTTHRRFLVDDLRRTRDMYLVKVADLQKLLWTAHRRLRLLKNVEEGYKRSRPPLALLGTTNDVAAGAMNAVGRGDEPGATNNRSSRPARRTLRPAELKVQVSAILSWQQTGLQLALPFSSSSSKRVDEQRRGYNPYQQEPTSTLRTASEQYEIHRLADDLHYADVREMLELDMADGVEELTRSVGLKELLRQRMANFVSRAEAVIAAMARLERFRDEIASGEWLERLLDPIAAGKVGAVSVDKTNVDVEGMTRWKKGRSTQGTLISLSSEKMYTYVYPPAPELLIWRMSSDIMPNNSQEEEAFIGDKLLTQNCTGEDFTRLCTGEVLSTSKKNDHKEDIKLLQNTLNQHKQLLRAPAAEFDHYFLTESTGAASWAAGLTDLVGKCLRRWSRLLKGIDNARLTRLKILPGDAVVLADFYDPKKVFGSSGDKKKNKYITGRVPGVPVSSPSTTSTASSPSSSFWEIDEQPDEEEDSTGKTTAETRAKDKKDSCRARLEKEIEQRQSAVSSFTMGMGTSDNAMNLVEEGSTIKLLRMRTQLEKLQASNLRVGRVLRIQRAAGGAGAETSTPYASGAVKAESKTNLLRATNTALPFVQGEYEETSNDILYVSFDSSNTEIFSLPRYCWSRAVTSAASEALADNESRLANLKRRREMSGEEMGRALAGERFV